MLNLHLFWHAASCALGLCLATAVGAEQRAVNALLIEPNAVPSHVRAQGGALEVRWSVDQMQSLRLNFGGSAAAKMQFSDTDAKLSVQTKAGEFGEILQADLPALTLDFVFNKLRIQRTVRASLLMAPGMLTAQWRDAQGQLWLQGGHAHPQISLRESGGSIEVRYLDLRIGPALAAQMGYPEIVDQYLGVANLSMPIVEQYALRGTPSCENPNWPSPTNKADVSLTEVSGFSPMRCSGCDGPGMTNGAIVVVPNATLKNVGLYDVPWYQKFSAGGPPYNNDQHPFLIWNMYRQDQDGVLRQFGKSGLKHAFFAANTGCDCPGGYVLGLNCEDAYGGASNDTPGDNTCSGDGTFCFQGVRSEMIPQLGLFGRCGSRFDPNCDGNQSDVVPYSPLEHRMLIPESELTAPAGSGVRWFGDAWYVVRDDGFWMNNIGSREITPNWVPFSFGGGVWQFLDSAPYQQGTILHRWHQSAPAAISRLTLVNTARGMVVIEVRASQLAPNQWRYQNTVFNLDFSVAQTSGADLQFRVLENRGINAITFAPSAPANLSFVRMVDTDLSPNNDWLASNQGIALRIAAVGGANTQDWGTLHTYIYDSSLPPGDMDVRISGLDAVEYSAQILGPTGAWFANGFE